MQQDGERTPWGKAPYARHDAYGGTDLRSTRTSANVVSVPSELRAALFFSPVLSIHFCTLQRRPRLYTLVGIQKQRARARTHCDLAESDAYIFSSLHGLPHASTYSFLSRSFGHIHNLPFARHVILVWNKFFDDE